MRKRGNRPKRAVRKTIGLVVDGETEHWYFVLLRRMEDKKLENVKLSPSLPKKTRLEDQFERVQEMAETHDKVFWLIDLDVLIKENREGRSRKPLDLLKGYLKTIQKEYTHVQVHVNTPCLEFWYLLHFENTGRYFNRCEDATRSLKRHLPDYEKTRKYYLRKKPNLYEVLRPNLPNAKERAKKLGSFNPNNPKRAQAGIHEIIDELGL